MKYPAVVLLLALVCAGTQAQDYLASALQESPPPITVSPLFIQPPPVSLHVSLDEAKQHPGRGKMLGGLAMVFAGAGLYAWGDHEVARGKERVHEYTQAHPQRGLHPDGDGGGGHTIQFWGNVMKLGGVSMASGGIYFVIRGAIKKRQFNKQYSDDYSPPAQQPAASMSVGASEALRKKISGIAMVGAGTALQIAGVILYSRAANSGGPDSNMDKTFGRAAFVAGTGLAVPGTLLWIKGARQQTLYKDYPSIHPRASLGLYLAPMPTLCYRF